MQEIIHSFGNYFIRFVPLVDAGDGKTKPGNSQFIIPATNYTNPQKEIIHCEHGARAFTRSIWAEICRSRKYEGIPVMKAALCYGGEIKCPGRHMMGDGTWYERAESDFKYSTVDGGQVCEFFENEGQVIMQWDPEPEPAPIVTVPEPEAPISVASVIPQDEAEQEMDVDRTDIHNPRHPYYRIPPDLDKITVRGKLWVKLIAKEDLDLSDGKVTKGNPYWFHAVPPDSKSGLVRAILPLEDDDDTAKMDAIGLRNYQLEKENEKTKEDLAERDKLIAELTTKIIELEAKVAKPPAKSRSGKKKEVTA